MFRTYWLLFGLLVSSASGAIRAADDPKELTPAERTELEKKAKALQEEGGRLGAEGKYTEAMRAMQQALAIRQRLYPPSRFPDGHSDLAESIADLGALLKMSGDLGQAQQKLEKAIAIYQKLYPPARFPDGNADFALTLNDLGLVLSERGDYSAALRFLEQAMAMQRRLYPASRFPDGHADLARTMNGLGMVLQNRGDYVRAQPYYEQALAMARKLYPPARYPGGHAELAYSLNNLGDLLMNRGEFAQAQPYLEQSLAMFQQLYPPDRCPDGHPLIAGGYINLGALLRARKEYAQAQRYFELALIMRRKLYPPAQFPHGHPELAQGLNNLGYVLVERELHEKAQPYLEQALAMYQKLYPAADFPHGHPDVARSLDNLANQMHSRGDYVRSQRYHEQALTMYRQLYPPQRYPDGHSDLYLCLNNLGSVFLAQGEGARARKCFAEALDMQHRLTARLMEVVADAEAFRFLDTLQLTRDGLLSVKSNRPEEVMDLYIRLWGGRAAVTRLLERRHQALLTAASGDAQVRRLWEELTDVRRSLGRLLLNPPADLHARDAQSRALTDRKERLERDLVRHMPALTDQPPDERLGPTELQRRLPAHAAFVDIIRYTAFEQDPALPGDKGEKRIPRYTAFVISAAALARVELGDAAAIDETCASWRRAIADKETHPAAEVLRRRVWEPLARHLPADTNTVYIAADGTLSALPWAALPGDRSGSVLLEHFMFALVPHGRSLLARLLDKPAGANDSARTLLAVGGVRYDDKPALEGNEHGAPRPAAEPAGLRGDFRFLPATEKELHMLRELGGKDVRILSGSNASTTRVLHELKSARRFHIATHGFFELAKFRDEIRRAEQQVKDWQLPRSGATLPVGLGTRNPLSYSGLVLAGANRPDVAGKDGGILTSETLLGQPLDKMELAVLSACHTGLGVVADDECARGLRQAFHVAGCKNVVISLWNVEDEATAALMAVFYDRLLRLQKPPLVALREAQLAMYYGWTDFQNETRERGSGPDFARRMKATVKPEAPKDGAKPAARAQPKLWAGFVLSGLGK